MAMRANTQQKKNAKAVPAKGGAGKGAPAKKTGSKLSSLKEAAKEVLFGKKKDAKAAKGKAAPAPVKGKVAAKGKAAALAPGKKGAAPAAGKKGKVLSPAELKAQAKAQAAAEKAAKLAAKEAEKQAKIAAKAAEKEAKAAAKIAEKEAKAAAKQAEKAARAQAELESMCREVACEGLATSAGYCRLHYIKNWKKIMRKAVILKEGKLNQYIEELVIKYPDKYIEAIRQDLANDKDFAKVIYDLDLDESVDDFEGEGESIEGVIDTIKRDFDDEGDTGF